MKTRLLFASALLLAACNKDGRELPDPDTDSGDADTSDVDTGSDTDTDSDTVDTSGPRGFIGSPCTNDNECSYEGGVCLQDAEGFPGGMCSSECDLYCPDEDGFPTTFCVAPSDLPESPLDAGSCSSRCDFQIYPDDGCRDGYGCVMAARNTQPNTEVYTCIPNAAPDLDNDLIALAARDVDFTPTSRADETAAGQTCHIENPVLLHPPIHGVDVAYYDGTPTPNILLAANAAIALVDTVDDLADNGATKVFHIGTYNCRVIAGTSTLSRHAYGDAIDIYGVSVGGVTYTLVDDWVHTGDIDDAPPAGTGGRYLYDAAHRWHDDRIWNIILTPEYNSAHDNHFHIDMTPGSNSIWSLLGVAPLYYIGPADYTD